MQFVCLDRIKYVLCLFALEIIVLSPMKNTIYYYNFDATAIKF